VKLTVAGMTDGGRFPMANAGMAPSPALSWTGVPAGTQSFAILLHDPDPVINKNASTDVTHWLIYDIPGDATSLPAGVPAGADVASGAHQFPNITGQPVYFGPAPPPGSGVHHYTWEIWALDAKIGPQTGNDRSVVIKAMDGHVLGKGLVIGLYGE
jgi:Raf kinase inhibitor-like YbhB/YbcL family protein